VLGELDPAARAVRHVGKIHPVDPVEVLANQRGLGPVRLQILVGERDGHIIKPGVHSDV